MNGRVYVEVEVPVGCS